MGARDFIDACCRVFNRGLHSSVVRQRSTDQDPDKRSGSKLFYNCCGFLVRLFKRPTTSAIPAAQPLALRAADIVATDKESDTMTSVNPLASNVNIGNLYAPKLVASTAVGALDTAIMIGGSLIPASAQGGVQTAVAALHAANQQFQTTPDGNQSAGSFAIQVLKEVATVEATIAPFIPQLAMLTPVIQIAVGGLSAFIMSISAPVVTTTAAPQIAASIAATGGVVGMPTG